MPFIGPLWATIGPPFSLHPIGKEAMGESAIGVERGAWEAVGLRHFKTAQGLAGSGPEEGAGVRPILSP
jgi:hypothetical protein